jgi:hypothetical protein
MINLSSNPVEIAGPTIHRVTDIKPGAYFIVNKGTNLGLDIQSDDPKVEPQVVCNTRKQIRSQKVSHTFVSFTWRFSVELCSSGRLRRGKWATRSSREQPACMCRSWLMTRCKKVILSGLALEPSSLRCTVMTRRTGRSGTSRRSEYYMARQ